jgi:hypothetical protein
LVILLKPEFLKEENKDIFNLPQLALYKIDPRYAWEIMRKGGYWRSWVETRKPSAAKA